MKKLIVVIATLCTYACTRPIMPSQTPYQNKDTANGKRVQMLLGHNAPFMLQQKPYADWFQKNYADYRVDSTTASQLKPLLNDVTLEIFLGTWCGDSKREVPRMLKILHYAGFDTTRLRLIFVNNEVLQYKQSPQREEKGKHVFRVPTFIAYRNNKETGRIIESPMVSLEKDLYAILSGQDYASRFKGVHYWEKEVKQRHRSMNTARLTTIATTLKTLVSNGGEFNAYGYMLNAQGKKKEAENVFILNTLLYPDRSFTYSSLGEFYFLNGNKAAAKPLFEKALQLTPNDAEVKAYLQQL